jgi:serine/threonine-protein kinase
LDFEFLLMEHGETRVLSFPPSPFVIGAAEACELRFPPPLVEARHAQVTVTGAKVLLTDLTGRGLTWVNGLAINSVELDPGAMVRLGQVELMLRPPRPASKPSPAVEPVEQTVRRPTPFGELALGHSAQVPVKATDLDAAPPPPPPQERQLTPGTIIGERYEIVSRLAAGGMGEVYKARHVELNKPMAIKVMRHQLSADPEFVARFKREAIATGSIGQMNIVDISDFGRTDDGRFYFVMEFLDGKTLSRVLRQDGALSTDRTLHIAVQVARALTAAHSLGVVHRDLKPENIMLIQKPGQRDLVKVVDFGVAKLPNPEGSKAYTVLGMVVGTPQYMSPEQARAVVVDHRSDIYSLGLIIHEMLAGKPTFEAETGPSLMVKQVTETPAPLVVEEGGSVELAELVMTMLAKAPDERPQSMEQVLLTLEDLISARRATYPAQPAVPRPSAPVTLPQVSLATPAPTRTVTGPRATMPPSHTERVPTPRPGQTPGQTGAKPVTAKLRRLPTGERLTIEHALETQTRPQPAPEEPAPEVLATDAELERAAMPRSKAPLLGGLFLVLAVVAVGGWQVTHGDGGGPVVKGGTSPTGGVDPGAKDPGAKEPLAKDPSAQKDPGGKDPGAKEPLAKDPSAQKDPGGKDPGSRDPDAKDPGAKEPGAKEPGVRDPGAKDPGAKDPGAKDPGAKDPAAKDPLVKDPGAKDPGARDPGAGDPSAKDPLAKKDPAAKEPGAKEPGAKDPGGAKEPHAAAMITLRLESSPPGAEIFEANTRLGTAPLPLRRPLDARAALRFSLAGYASATKEVAFTRDGALTVSLIKLPAADATTKPPPGHHDTPELVDPYATDPTPKEKPKKAELKEGVY